MISRSTILIVGAAVGMALWRMPVSRAGEIPPPPDQGKIVLLDDFEEHPGRHSPGWALPHQNTGAFDVVREIVKPGAAGSASAVHLRVRVKGGYASFALSDKEMPADVDGCDLLCFWARTGSREIELSLNIVEKDCTRWDSSCLIGPEWTQIVLGRDAFSQTTPLSSIKPEDAAKRRTVDTLVNLDSIRALSFIISGEGWYDLYLDEVCLARTRTIPEMVGRIETAQTMISAFCSAFPDPGLSARLAALDQRFDAWAVDRQNRRGAGRAILKSINAEYDTLVWDVRFHELLKTGGK